MNVLLNERTVFFHVLIIYNPEEVLADRLIDYMHGSGYWQFKGGPSDFQILDFLKVQKRK